MNTQLIKRLGTANVGVAFDTFHVSIEEPDVIAAIHNLWLQELSISTSTRTTGYYQEMGV